MIIAVTMMLVFTMVSVSTLQLQLCTGAEQKEQALNLAESAIHLALGELQKDATFGTNKEHAVVSAEGLLPGSRGLVTFDSDEAADEGQPCSTHNLASRTARPGDGRRVPGECVHLVGVGQVGNLKSTVECLYYRPSCPTGLIAGGTVNATGLYLTGLLEGVDPASRPASGFPPEQLRPADLFSNSNSQDAAEPAVKLGPGCLISGDVGAVGRVNLDEGCDVRGEVRPASPPQTVPDFDLAGIRARLDDNNIQPSAVPPVMGGVLEIPWFTESAGSLTVNGDLQLTGGLLFVAGDLRVTGVVKGRGLVIATGRIDLQKGSQVEAKDLLAVGSGGDLTLTGQDKRHTFQGLLYCGGNLEASDVTVLGSIVAKNKVRLDNVDVIQTRISATMAFGAPMRMENGDDTVFWRVNPVRDQASGQLSFEWFMAIYYAPWVNTYAEGAQYFIGQNSGSGNRDQVKADLLAAVDGDYNAGQASAAPSALIGAQLDAYMDAISGAGPSSTFEVSFDLNEVVSAFERPRILLWRRL